MAFHSESPLPGFRLPKDIAPQHYDLAITTYLDEDNFSFEGDMHIEIKCNNVTNIIKVHARDLTFDNTNVSLKSLEETKETDFIQVVNTEIDTENEFYIVTTAKPLVTGKKYSLHLPFKGILKEQLIGYYRSSYYDHEAKSEKWLSVTHFEPSDARQAFPCFDEPGFKATFSIRLAHRENFKSVSNMPLVATTPYSGKPGWVWSEFERTVPMSTYLVAYMVSEFAYRESPPSPNNITFRVWARPDALSQSVFPSVVGPHFLSYYEDFFDVKYPLPKQDLLAIPDFKIGAMENWGIITFREGSLLLDDKITSSTAKLGIALIIAHELAHMWFGNLVTMKWWTDLWLKEGFATYMASLAVHHEFPEWNSLDENALSDLLRVFHLDSLKSSHPVSVPIGHPREISQIFDAISYDKGSFLLRMMSLFLGEEVFRHGVSGYLKKHQYSNAVQDDLWESLTEQAHRYQVLPPDLTVKQIMDSWTLQTGYPLITVIRDYQNHKATISQKRFLAVKSEKAEDYKGRWWVPISYSSAREIQFNRTQPQHWLSADKETSEIDIKAGQGEWLILNNKAAGLYRINYDTENWGLISKALNSEKFQDISVMNRAQLIIDSMDLADQGLVDYRLALEITSYVSKEKSYVPWDAALSKLDPIKSKLIRTANFSVFKKYMQQLLSSVVESIGDITQEQSSFEGNCLLNIITMWACPMKVGDCPNQANKLFNKWRNEADPDNNNPIPKDVRRTVYSHGVKEGGQEAWEFLWERYKNANVTTEKNNILVALTAAKDIWLINRYLEWTLDENSGVRKQDAFIIFKMIAGRDVGYYVAQKFFFQNVKRISEFFGPKSNLIGHYFTAVANQMIHPYELEELKSFAETNQELLAPASLVVSQALESVQVNIHWMKMHYETLSYVLAHLTHSDQSTIGRYQC